MGNQEKSKWLVAISKQHKQLVCRVFVSFIIVFNQDNVILKYKIFDSHKHEQHVCRVNGNGVNITTEKKIIWVSHETKVAKLMAPLCRNSITKLLVLLCCKLV